MSCSPQTAFGAHDWGSAPELYGPRHDYREALILRRLLPRLPGPQVLNAGAGAGSLTHRLLRAGCAVTSIDASGELCRRLAAELAGTAAGARVLRCDVVDTGLPDRAFDGVVCAEVLEHLADDRAALTELARVLRPGGLLLVTVPAGPFRYDWVDLWAGHLRRYEPSDLAGKITGAGFGAVEVDGWGFPLSAAYHRWVYRPALRRRLARARGPGGAPPRAARTAVRAALELDSLFLGRTRGALGLIATARRAGS